MRPIRVTFQCFGPYLDEQTVDFETLGRDGLFLITGETGAGKTTILDAICYALYGKSSGGLRGEIEVMRCKAAQKSDVTRVEFVFESGGKRYRFCRELRYGRTNLNEFDSCELIQGEDTLPLLENPKKTAVNRKAEEIIGLTYDQFCQVIMLPQGKFEKLLVSDSADKEAILTTLFHADKWDRLAAGVKQAADEAAKALELERAFIRGKLQETACCSLDELADKAAAMAAAADAEAEALNTLSRRKQQTAEVYEAALRQNEGFLERNRRRTALGQLEQQKPLYARKQAALGRAEAAESIRGQYEAYAREARARDQALAKAKEARQKLEQAELAHAAAKQAQARHEALRPAWERTRDALVRMEDARPAYAEIDGAQKTYRAAYEAAGAAKAGLDRAAEACRRADEAWTEARAQNEAAMGSWQRLNRLFSDQIAGILASELRENLPCPVCGSTVHPAPARIGAGESVTKQDVDQANDRVLRTASAQKKAEALRNEREKARADAEAAFNAARDRCSEAKSRYEAAISRKLEGVETEAELEQAIQSRQQKLRKYEDDGAAVAAKLTAAAAGLQSAEDLRNAAEAEAGEAAERFAAVQTAWRTALAGAQFPDEAEYLRSALEPRARRQLQEDCHSFLANLKRAQEDLDEQEKLLAGMEAPDLVRLKQEKDAADQAYTDANARLEGLKKEAANVARLHGQLVRRWDAYNEAKTAADANSDFAARLNPRSGISLKRYVLGVMLSYVTTAANQLLKNVRGGQYQLVRSSESSGSSLKAGLELDVIDCANGGERRSVTTLSGGEKFLVALCLAIGLSTVVQTQSGGARLEAMFVDEGFGSLDDSCIYDALEVLQSVRRSNGFVAIISHVETLRSVIPMQLRIRNGARGSALGV